MAETTGYAPKSKASTFTGKLRRLGIWGQILSLAIVVLIFGIGSSGNFLKPDNIQAIISLACIPILLCLGIHQVIILGGMDMSLEGVVAICGVAAGLLLKNNVNSMDWGLWVIPAVMILGGAIGFINGIIHTKLKMPSFIATLGINWVFFGLAILISGGRSIPIHDTRFQAVMFGNYVLGIPNIAFFAVFFMIIFELFQNRCKTGIAMYAVGGDESLARQAGINVSRIKIAVFVIAGIMYGIAALGLVTRLNSAAVRIGNLLLFPAMTAVAVGGVSLTGGLGKARNAVLGCIIISALNNGMVMMRVSPFAQDAVNGLVLIVAVALTIDRKKLGFIK